jgi:hypothetical protein
MNNTCTTASSLYSQCNNSTPGNCIDNSKSSAYDLPGKNKRMPIGEVLTITRDSSDNVLLCKLYNNYILSSGDLIGWSANNSWKASTGTIKDIIHIGNIARVVI